MPYPVVVRSNDPAARAQEGRGRKKGRDPHFALRKRLRHQAEREYPGRRARWYGGILYFVDRGFPPQKVPGVQDVPKPNAEAVGWYESQVVHAHQPKPEPERYRWR